MSAREQRLADRLEQANQQVIAFVENASPPAWSRNCAEEPCTVAALAHHVGGGRGDVLDHLVRPIAAGSPAQPYTLDGLNRWNAQDARDNAAGSKDGALAQPREQGERAVADLRSIGDEQLDRGGTLPFGGDPMTAEQVIERIPIGHPEQHLAAMQSAAGSSAP